MADTVADTVLDALDDDAIAHVYPQFGRKHVTDQRAGCWCRPDIEMVEGGAVIVHHIEQ